MTLTPAQKEERLALEIAWRGGADIDCRDIDGDSQWKTLAPRDKWDMFAVGFYFNKMWADWEFRLKEVTLTPAQKEGRLALEMAWRLGAVVEWRYAEAGSQWEPLPEWEDWEQEWDWVEWGREVGYYFNDRWDTWEFRLKEVT